MSPPEGRWPRPLVGALLVGGSILLALEFLRAWQTGVGPNAYLAFDTYHYFYRNMLHAAQAVADGGRGLFWNPFEDCGQQFFGIGSTALLYPPHWLFLWLDPDLALRAVIVFHLVVGAVAMYALCRELGASRVAAVAAAVAFELGNATLEVTAWMPIVAAPYVWMPAAMLYCERTLRAPTIATGIRLGLVLSLALLAGFPQTVMFTYQLIGLRFLWELVVRRPPRAARILAVLALGLLLPVLLDAVQLLPAVGTARTSLRGGGLDAADMAPQRYSLQASKLRIILGARGQVKNPWVLVPAMIAAASLVAARTRRFAAFYLIVGVAYFMLAFGSASPLFSIYSRLPLASLFRAPVRFVWMTSFCLTVLTAFGTDALTRASTGARGSPAPGFVAVLCAAAMSAVCAGLSITELQALEWTLALSVIAAGLIAALAPAAGRAAAIAVAAAVCVNLAWFHTPGAVHEGLLAPARPIVLPRLIPDGAELRAQAAAFAPLARRATAQDRLYLVYRGQTPSFGARTPSLFGLSGVGGYEPQPSRRFAEYSVMLRYGRRMKFIDEYYGAVGGTLPPSFRRRLLDLAGGRYLLVEPRAENSLAVLQPSPALLATEGNLSLYENPLALPRAFYVSRLEVVSDAQVLLERISEGTDDLRRVALVEQVPSSGFTGVPGDTAGGEVEFVVNEPEHVVLRVRAPEHGFVHLADQYAEGWRATLEGRNVPILRANFLFRLVEVPAGESTIDMRYVAPGLRLGAAVSLATVLALLVYALRTFFSPRHGRG